MNNTQIIAAVIVIVAIAGFVFASKRGEAPIVVDEQNTTPTSALEDGEYSIKKDQSYITWSGEYIGGLKETGKVMLSSGSAVVTAGLLTNATFVIDFNTITDDAGKERLENHLKNEDFFDIAKYPTGTFELKSFAPVEGSSASPNRFVISGDLTVRNIKKPVSFIAEVNTLADGSVVLTSNFALNRADWEIKYNSPSFFGNLGDKAIRDAIEIGLNIVAEKDGR